MHGETIKNAQYM